jgi:acyl-CoA thioesterase-1
MYRTALLVMLTCGLAACDAPAPPAARPLAIPSERVVSGPQRTVLAFGDSLFAGYNLAEAEGYPEQLEMALREASINARVIDAGVSGDTTAAGRQRIAFVLDNAAIAPDLAIVELGGNDMLRGITPDQTRANLDAILTELAQRDIPVLLMGMRAPPNLGAQYQAEFDGLYPALAQQHCAALVPFFLEAVYDQPALIQDDRIHPTAEGVVALVAATSGAVVDALPD